MTIQRVVGASADGQWGPQTVEDVRIWQAHQGLTSDGKVGPGTLRAILAAAGQGHGGHGGHGGTGDGDDGDHSHHDPPNVSGTIHHVGAWTGLHSLGHRAAADVQFCKDHNINRLDVFVNNFARARHATPFNTYDADEIADLCRRATDAGLDVHITSWVMPHAEFIAGAAEQLIPLCERAGAKSLMWDAEEPWNRAVDGLPYAEAAERLASAFSTLSCPMGVTGITVTSKAKVGPLASKCAYLAPQCYATSRNNLDPSTVASHGVDRWRQMFGDKKFMVGLAAYRQSVVHGLGTREAMIASLNDVKSLEIDTISYWSLRWIQQSTAISAVVSEILGTR